MLVEVPEDGLYLVGVGFGDSFRQPLRWKETGPQPDFGSEYRLEETAEGRVLAQRLPGEQWAGQQLIITRQGERSEYILPDRATYFEKLEQHFGVIISPELRQVLEKKVGPQQG